MSLAEYSYRMKAYSLARIDQVRDMHYQALLIRNAALTEKKGKGEVYKYKDLDSFFNYEEAIARIEKPKTGGINENQREMARLAAKLNG